MNLLELEKQGKTLAQKNGKTKNALTLDIPLHFNYNLSHVKQKFTVDVRDFMNILITSPMLKDYSAVGNDVEAMYRILAAEHNCKVHAEHKFSQNAGYIRDKDLKRFLSDKDSLLIYHHSVYWEKGKHMLKKAKCKIIFRYHNITPPSFFENYNEIYKYACECGREQTVDLIRDFPNALWLCNSSYSAEDLVGVPKQNIFICPPFNKTEEWAKAGPDKELLQKLRSSDEINLLFVGRVTPHKGHLFLIDVVNHYVKNFDTGVKLRIIGDIGIEGYHLELKHKIKVYGLEHYIEFIGEVTDNALLSYYMGSDFLVSASEHEGFFVPAAEAQYLGLPIIARSMTAVPDTVGENQVLLHDDPKEYAAAIHVLHGNAEYCEFLREQGRNNFANRFSSEKITEVFVEFLGRGCVGVCAEKYGDVFVMGVSFIV